MFGLIHTNADWLIAGTIVFIGIVVFVIKLLRGHILSTICSLTVWIFVFSLHKGSTTGIMTATFAALLFDTIGMPLISLFTKSKR